MVILSHRGEWKYPDEKNTPEAFGRSLKNGFGVEIDLRDREGEVVVSHDPPGKEALLADVYFEAYRRAGTNLPLAMNIKSDGLARLLDPLLKKFGIKNYFVFDMSVPETLRYIDLGFVVFSRQSDVEPSPTLSEFASGIWLDAFHGEWVDEASIDGHLVSGKKVCLVSPELHQRPRGPFWEKLAKFRSIQSNDLMLCTDHPGEARRFFNVAH